MSALEGISETILSSLVRSLKERLGPQGIKHQGHLLLESPDPEPVAKIPLLWEFL